MLNNVEIVEKQQTLSSKSFSCFEELLFESSLKQLCIRLKSPVQQRIRNRSKSNKIKFMVSIKVGGTCKKSKVLPKTYYIYPFWGKS